MHLKRNTCSCCTHLLHLHNSLSRYRKLHKWVFHGRVQVQLDLILSHAEKSTSHCKPLSCLCVLHSWASMLCLVYDEIWERRGKWYVHGRHLHLHRFLPWHILLFSLWHLLQHTRFMANLRSDRRNTLKCSSLASTRDCNSTSQWDLQRKLCEYSPFIKYPNKFDNIYYFLKFLIIDFLQRYSLDSEPILEVIIKVFLNSSMNLFISKIVSPCFWKLICLKKIKKKNLFERSLNYLINLKRQAQYDYLIN